MIVSKEEFVLMESKQKEWEECEQVLIYDNDTPTPKVLYMAGYNDKNVLGAQGCLAHMHSDYRGCKTIHVNAARKQIRIQDNKDRIIQYVGHPWQAQLKNKQK